MKSPLKIGLLSYRSNPHCGGQGVYIRHLSRALCDLGHQVEVIAGPPDPQLNGRIRLTMLKTLDLYNPDALFRTPSLEELSDRINLLEWLDVCSMGYPEPWTFGMRVVQHLKGREDKYDIIHDNQSLSYGLLALMKKVPVTATIHHPMTVDRRLAVKATRSFYKKLKILRWYSFIGMQKRVARRLPGILTVSEASKQDISKEFTIPENRFFTIPNGIDTQSFHPLETVKRIPGRIIVTNSADTPLKGLYHLLHAIKNIVKKHPVFLVVVGTPKKNGGIERLVRQLDLGRHLAFTGRISQDRFVKEYARASIAVVPSLYEGFGLPVGEAMACRIPVICTTGGALPEVAGDAAKLVPPGDSNALEKAILELLEDPAQQEALAGKGYDRVLSHFTWEATARKTVQAYRRIIHDHH
ncbi:MAG TPA: glycosyltransferase family 4 protein [Desulfotignum sp.]|jgi:glycosyltransferase involved in cell wall biosynthesis|nr:glycosyltransferase family 4 protein [Desulfotignum sp.]